MDSSTIVYTIRMLWYGLCDSSVLLHPSSHLLPFAFFYSVALAPIYNFILLLSILDLYPNQNKNYRNRFAIGNTKIFQKKSARTTLSA